MSVDVRLTIAPTVWRTVPDLEAMALNAQGLVLEAIPPLSTTSSTPGQTSTDHADYAIPDLDPTPGVDNTAAILTARTRASTRNIPLFIPPGCWKMTDVLTLWDGARIYSQGGCLDIWTDHSTTGRGIYGTTVDDVIIEGLTIAQGNATGRNGVYGMITLLASGGTGSSNVRVRSTHVTGGESTGFYAELLTDFELDHLTVTDTWADGIHLTRGTSRGVITSPRVARAGDDAVALVSVTSESGGAVTWPQMTDVAVTNVSVQDLTTLGSGVAIVGPKRVTVSGGTIKTVHHSGVNCQANPAIGAPAPSDIAVTGLAVDGSAGNAFTIGDSVDVTVTGVTGRNCGDTGMSLIGATRAHVTGAKFRGNTGFGVYETGGSGNTVVNCDLRGNTAGAYQVSSAALTGCVTA